MKVYIIQTVARQVNGEYVMVRVDKAFTSKDKAKSFYDGSVKVRTETISGIQYACEKGLIEIDVDE